MSENLSPLEMISANAYLVVAAAQDELGRDVGLDADGVRWLDGYVQRLHDQGGVDEPEALCDRLGAFLGECIIQAYGGRWQEDEQGWAIILDGDLAVYPFNKTYKHLAYGAEDSVMSLFNSIPALLAHKQAESTESMASDAGSSSLLDKLGGVFRRR